MKDFISFYFKGLFLFITNTNFRTFARLFAFSVFKKRYTLSSASFNGNKIKLADAKSFIWQYYEIYVRKFYDFDTNSQQPVIYDCGANIGISVLFFSKKHPTAKIVAFEPSQHIFELLENNVKTNNLKNIVLHKSAVWTKNERLGFNDEGSDGGSLYTSSNSKTIQVQAIDLLVQLETENKIDFLKIDIEGVEVDIFEHISKAFYKVEKIFVEYHSFNNQTQRLDELLRVLKQNNFRYYIKHSNDRTPPFINLHNDREMDMQLNIFAYKQ